MSHHFTKSTVQAEVWCSKCAKFTAHRVFDGRRGACLVCEDKLDQAAKQRPAKVAPVQQGRLF